MGGYHDHGRPGPISQELREVKAAHAGQVNIGDDAVIRFCTVTSDKFFCRCKPAGAISQRRERIDKRQSECFVVIDDRD
jgi:hypothetical protein